jgi:hypothetical protein
VLFVTNNSTKSRAAFLGKFHSLGLPAAAEEIYGSAYAGAQYLKCARGSGRPAAQCPSLPQRERPPPPPPPSVPVGRPHGGPC